MCLLFLDHFGVFVLFFSLNKNTPTFSRKLNVALSHCFLEGRDGGNVSILFLA